MIQRLTIIRYAIADLLHERRLFAVLIVGVAAVVGPLLLLAGLKDGVVEQIRDELKRSPINREITLVGQGRFEAAWFDDMSRRDDVAFVAPRTRFLSTSLNARNAENRRVAPTRAELWPSGAGDPLIDPEIASRIGGYKIALSANLAADLELAAGQKLTVIIAPGGARAPLRQELEVVGVAAIEATPRRVIFADTVLMLAIEKHLETGAPFELAPIENDRVFASFRLYARAIDDVEGLRLALRSADWRIETRAEEIAAMLRLQEALGVLFLVTMALMATGGAFSVGLNISANALGKSREICVLQVLGHRARSLALFPVSQAACVAGCGGALGLLIYALAAHPVAHLLSESVSIKRDALDLSFGGAAATIALALAVCVVSALGAARHLLNLDPSIGLRDG